MSDLDMARADQDRLRAPEDEEVVGHATTTRPVRPTRSEARKADSSSRPRQSLRGVASRIRIPARLIAFVNDDVTPDGVELRVERIRRARVLVGSAVGVACLLVAQALHPAQGPLIESLRTFPTDVTAWLALLCGLIGMWLVPGLWLSALVARLGVGLTAWMGTRIATTLIWYTLINPVIHQLGRGARITTPGLLIATIGATAAVAVGIALGMSRWPVRRWQRVLVPALVGAVLAQVGIWVWTSVWVFGMNYEHIRRLDWLIVLGSAVLVVVGTLNKPAVPPMRTVRNSLVIVASFAVVALTVAAAMFANQRWSPEQRMPSAFSVEQVPAPFGVSVAFDLSAIGPDGPAMISDAEWAAFDDAGRLVPAYMETAASADSEQLYVVLVPGTQPQLCRPGRAAKLSVRDMTSGVFVQATIPDGWCPP